MPPEGEVAKLNIGVEAKLDKYQRNLKQAEAMAKKSAAKIEKTTNNINFGGLVGSALKATAAFGALELGLKGAEAIGSALTGNFEEAAGIIKTLPAGIGPFATVLESILGKVTGITAQTEKLKKEAEEIAMDLSLIHI